MSADTTDETSKGSTVTDIIRLSAAEMASKLADGSLTSVELTQAHLDRIAEGLQQHLLELDDQVAGFGADVVEQVAGGGDRGVHRALDLGERLEFLGQRLVRQPAPGVVRDADIAGEDVIGGADVHVLDQVVGRDPG